MNEKELGRLLTSVVPNLTPPADRINQVDRRVRRSRRVAMVSTVAAMVTAILIGGAFLTDKLTGTRPAPMGVGASSVRPSLTTADGILRTGGCATYHTAGPTTIAGTPVDGNSAIVNDLNNRVVSYAMEHFSSVYALTELVSDIGVLRVYRVPSAAFDEWAMRELAHDCLQIADARSSAVEMEATAHHISDDRSYWSKNGIHVLSVSGNPIDGTLEVAVPAKDLDKARRDIPRHYPSLQVRIVAGGPDNGRVIGRPAA